MDLKRKKPTLGKEMFQIDDDKNITNNDDISDMSSHKVSDSSNPDVLSNPLPSKSNSQRIPVTANKDNSQTCEENFSSAALPNTPSMPVINCLSGKATLSVDASSKQPKKMNFLKSLTKKARKNKNSSNSSLSTCYNDESNQLQIPKILRSSSVGILSELFFGVHNLCVAPAHVSDELLDNLQPSKLEKITNSHDASTNTCLTCPQNIITASSASSNHSFSSRISRSITRSAKQFSKHKSVSPQSKNRVAPARELWYSCNNVSFLQSNISPNKEDRIYGENLYENIDISNTNSINESVRENKLKRKHYRKKKQCDQQTNNIYRKTIKKSNTMGFNGDNVHPLQTIIDMKQESRSSYGSENSSIGDVSTTSNASSYENKSTADDLLTNNKSGLSHRSSSLGQLTSLHEVSPLGLITPAVARQRNYLFGGLGSLLGPTEMERYFPNRTVTIFVATWNMNAKPAPPSLDDFLLPDDMEVMPDIYVIGTQESDSNMTEFEVMLQTSIGPSHVLFSSAVFGILHLTIFLRRDLVWFCSVPEEDSHGLRPGTYFKTKGALAISFQFFGTRILLITSHLFAHEEKLDQRLLNYKNIVNGLDLPKNLRRQKILKSKDVTHRYDVVFWMGDLNFRLVGDRERILDLISVASTPADFDDLLCHDQLTQAKNKGQVFNGFDEAEIRFLPTFKFDVGTNRYDTSSKQRVPSYTDRIFYRSTRDPINCIRYDSCPVFMTSDHKPVWGLYTFKVRPGKDDVPLAAGLFQRDIYLEALKRRRRLFHQPSSRNCQTQ